MTCSRLKFDITSYIRLTYCTTSSTSEESRMLDPSRELSRFVINESNGSIDLILSHILFDGYSLGRFFTYIDEIVEMMVKSKVK